MESGRDFWRGVVTAGGFTAVPRWVADPVSGVGVYEVAVADDVAGALREVAEGLGVPVGAVVLAAHARVLAVLSGEREVTTGYVTAGSGALPCRLAVDAVSWRELVQHAAHVVSDLLAHRDFPVGDLRWELGLAGPAFETAFDVCGGGGDLPEDVVLGVGICQDAGRLVLRFRYRTDVLDAECAGRIAGYHLSALARIADDADAG
ncbi:non-ribosomal peptide synthetase, partial [Streptomyces sp. NPDC057445]